MYSPCLAAPSSYALGWAIGLDAPSVASAQGAQHVVLAALSYHWARANWRGSGEQHVVPLVAVWVVGFARIARETATTVIVAPLRAHAGREKWQRDRQKPS